MRSIVQAPSWGCMLLGTDRGSLESRLTLLPPQPPRCPDAQTGGAKDASGLEFLPGEGDATSRLGKELSAVSLVRMQPGTRAVRACAGWHCFAGTSFLLFS